MQMLANINGSKLTKQDEALVELGQIANMGAARESATDYIKKKANNTLRRHSNDLAVFSRYFASIADNTEYGQALSGLSEAIEKFSLELKPDGKPNLNAFNGVTWGMVKKYIDWLTSEGYAINSINAMLSAVKIYMRLASLAGIIPDEELAKLSLVKGYRQSEGKRVDEKRETKRIGEKKAHSVLLSQEQADLLKSHPDTPQGRRDTLLMCLLLDHGLRVSEVALLQTRNVDLSSGTLSFYRPKTGKDAIKQELTRDTLKAFMAHTMKDAIPDTTIRPLLVGSAKGGKLSDRAMSTRAITKRVNFLGKKIGVEGLSAHDCRHYAATRLAPKKNIKELESIFGWTSPAMASRYIEASEVVTLD